MNNPPCAQIARDGSEPARARLTAPWPLSVAPSRIPGAGSGVWACADLPKGLVFGPYEGTVIKNPTEESGYAWEVLSSNSLDMVYQV